MKIIDLSVVLNESNISLVPGHPAFELKEIVSHDKNFASSSVFRISTHTGTHVDAPYHFIPDGITIDSLPLEKIVGKAVLIDLTKVALPRSGISADQIKTSLGKKKIRAKIAILHSGWLKEKWGKNEMYLENPFLLKEAADWLISQDIKSVGLDFSLDNPDQSALPPEKRFPIHRTFLKQGIPHIENLANLELIPQEEFLFVALPLKLYKCNGAPAGAIAIID